MKKFIVALCVAAMLSLGCFSAFAVGTETVVKTKNRDIKITVIDDFSTYSGEVGPCGNAFYTFDGEKLTFAIETGYAYSGPVGNEYKSPAASADGIKELYNNAKYIGMRIKNTGGVEISIALEKDTDGADAWLTQLKAEAGCLLASESVGIYNAEYEDINAIYRGYAVKIPAGFDGWLFIPFSSLRLNNDEKVEGEKTNDRCIMDYIHFSGANTNEEDGILEIDDFCLTSEDLAADAEAPTPGETEAPTPAPVQSEAPTAGETKDNAVTAEPSATPIPAKGNSFPWVPVVIAVVAVVAIVVIVVVVSKKKK